MSDAEWFAYIGTKPCGCVVAAYVDNPIFNRDDLQKFIGEMVMDGLMVERVKGPISVSSCKCGMGDEG